LGRAAHGLLAVGVTLVEDASCKEIAAENLRIPVVCARARGPFARNPRGSLLVTRKSLLAPIPADYNQRVVICAAQEEMPAPFAPPMVGSDEEIFSLAAAVAVAFVFETHTGENTVSGKKSHQGIFSKNRTIALAATWVKWSETHWDSGTWRAETVLGPTIYGYDGHGSVRQLTNAAGAVTDSYDYDAFGNLINSTGSTPNNYLFASEQYDPALALYYNRARYLNTTTGRFWTMDSTVGSDVAPLSLHRYFYAGEDPVNRLDPSGHDFDLGSTIGALEVSVTIDLAPVIRGVAILGLVCETLCKKRPEEPTDKIFFRGTTALDAAETVSNQAIDVERLVARQSGAVQLDFGSGLYMTKSYQTANIFAQAQGAFGRQGGPGILLINVSQQS
jgi:RHS repeat-associated protein